MLTVAVVCYLWISLPPQDYFEVQIILGEDFKYDTIQNAFNPRSYFDPSVKLSMVPSNILQSNDSWEPWSISKKVCKWSILFLSTQKKYL